MAESTIWWLAAGAAVAIELLSGTFYLLMLALGLAAGALAAHAGASLSMQLVLGAAVGGGAVAVWHFLHKRGATPAAASANRDVNLDIGSTVHVDQWNADGTATVKYRGAQWTVSCATAAPLDTGPHRVREVVGSRLIVEKI